MRKAKLVPSGILGRRNLPLMLLEAREALLQHFRPIFHRFGLTEQQWRILRILVDQDQLEQNQIASACQFSGPSLSNILSKLEGAGYVTRRRKKDDYRKVFVSLSKRGRTLIDEVAPDVDERYRELEKILGEDLMTSLFLVLDRLLGLPLNSVDKPEKGRGQTPV